MSSLKKVEVMGAVSFDLVNIISFLYKKSFHNVLNVPVNVCFYYVSTEQYVARC